MKKLLICLSLIYISVSYFQCSYEDECDQIDWIGVYNFEAMRSFGCTGSQMDNNFPSEIIIEEGSSSNQIIVNGTETSFSNCSVSLGIGEFSIEYQEFTIYLSGSACSATYTKE